MFFPHCSRKTILRVNLQLLKTSEVNFGHDSQPTHGESSMIHDVNSRVQFNLGIWQRFKGPLDTVDGKSPSSPIIDRQKTVFQDMFRTNWPKWRTWSESSEWIQSARMPFISIYCSCCHCKHSFNVLYTSTFIWCHGISWQLKEFHSPVCSFCCR